MEIVIAILILIGALAVGSNSSTSDETLAGKQLDRSEQVVTESGVDTSQVPCRIPNGRLMQRDLTVTRAPAFPSSNDTARKAKIRCPNE